MVFLIRNNLQREKPEIKEPIIIKNFLFIIFLSLIQPTNGSVNMSIIFAKNRNKPTLPTSKPKFSV